MTKGKTQSGFEYEVDTEILKDVRFLMELAKARKKKDDIEYLPLLEKLMGQQEFERLCKHCEDENGIAQVAGVLQEFKEILVEINKDKESKN